MIVQNNPLSCDERESMLLHAEKAVWILKYHLLLEFSHRCTKNATAGIPQISNSNFWSWISPVTTFWILYTHTNLTSQELLTYLLIYAHHSWWSIGHLQPLAIALCSGLLWLWQRHIHPMWQPHYLMKFTKYIHGPAILYYVWKRNYYFPICKTKAACILHLKTVAFCDTTLQDGKSQQLLFVVCLMSQHHPNVSQEISAQTIEHAVTVRQKLQINPISSSQSILSQGQPVPVLTL